MQSDFCALYPNPKELGFTAQRINSVNRNPESTEIFDWDRSP